MLIIVKLPEADILKGKQIKYCLADMLNTNLFMEAVYTFKLWCFLQINCCKLVVYGFIFL